MFRMTTMILLIFAGVHAGAANYFDGKRPLLCTAAQMFECDLTYGCLQVTPDELGATNAWAIDFKKQQLTPTGMGRATNAIGHVEVLDNKIFMTSVQDGDPEANDGVAWSASINAADGLLTLMIAGEGVGFVGLGNCIPN